MVVGCEYDTWTDRPTDRPTPGQEKKSSYVHVPFFSCYPLDWGLLFGGSWGETRGGASAPPQRVPSEPRGPPPAALKGSARRPSDPLRVPRGALKRAPSDPAPTLRRLQEPLVCCGLHRTQVLPKSVERDFQAHKQDARGSNIEKPHPAAQTALQKQNCLS